MLSHAGAEAEEDISERLARVRTYVLESGQLVNVVDRPDALRGVEEQRVCVGDVLLPRHPPDCVDDVAGYLKCRLGVLHLGFGVVFPPRHADFVPTLDPA